MTRFKVRIEMNDPKPVSRVVTVESERFETAGELSSWLLGACEGSRFIRLENIVFNVEQITTIEVNEIEAWEV